MNEFYTTAEFDRQLERARVLAMATRGIQAEWTPASLARHTQAVLQGAFIIAKATGNRDVARESVDHLRRYVELLFQTKRCEGQAA